MSPSMWLKPESSAEAAKFVELNLAGAAATVDEAEFVAAATTVKSAVTGARFELAVSDTEATGAGAQFKDTGAKCKSLKAESATKDKFVVAATGTEFKSAVGEWLSGGEWFDLTEGSAIPACAPLVSIPKGRNGLEWDVLTREAVTLLIKGAAAECGTDTKLVGTHSIRNSGATSLLLAGITPEVVQIIGRWASNAFIGYTRYQAELMKGVATCMVNTHYVVRSKPEMW